MKQELDKIFELEEQKNFDEVYELYQNLYSENKFEYEVWKNFYFFLWTAIEDAPNEFQEKIEIRKLMQQMYDDGKSKFSEIADFNFIAGYTVSIFPYEYGDYDDLEREANQLLKKVTELEPENIIYRLAYFGSIENVDKQMYRKLEIEASPIVLKIFNGKGTLNKYVKQALNRIDRKAYR
ncbi:hypothetical protein [Sphingobacterium hungaricum]|uniref:Uncharacterized protein n=1 Tax=Sphingobacterium hungaricum TaxID=2082723 RepID=A0A928UXB4_9SPHI|nr:hypothetical protein [Sphingobacterium hungaricum]MBE8712824.1 hypothetical protein [Sphingobacterium hungaricum]